MQRVPFGHWGCNAFTFVWACKGTQQGQREWAPARYRMPSAAIAMLSKSVTFVILCRTSARPTTCLDRHVPRLNKFGQRSPRRAWRHERPKKRGGRPCGQPTGRSPRPRRAGQETPPRLAAPAKLPAPQTSLCSKPSLSHICCRRTKLAPARGLARGDLASQVPKCPPPPRSLDAAPRPAR